MKQTKVTPDERALTVLRRGGPLMRLSELVGAGVHRDTVRQLTASGALEQVSRGLYRLSGAAPLTEPDLVVVARRVPGAVVCLVSALSLHELTTQIPHGVDIALSRGRRRPRLEFPPIHVYWWSPAALEQGIETRSFGGVDVRVTTAERSVADVFRYRNQLGLDLAIEALRAWRERRGSKPERLLEAARVVRVEKALLPYLQAVL